MPTFGDRFTDSFRTPAGSTVTVTLLKGSYTDAVESMRLAGEPFGRSGAKSGSDEWTPLRPYVGTMIVHPRSLDVVDEIYADDTPWRVRLEVDGTLDFLGSVRKNLPERSDDLRKDPFELNVNCGLGQLQNEDFTAGGGSLYTEKRSVIAWITEILSKLDFGLDVAAASEWYAHYMDQTLCPLEQEYVDPAAYIDEEDGAWTCFEVLEDLVGAKLAFLAQERGRWHVYQRSLYRKDSIDRWVYSAGWQDGDASPSSESYTTYVDASTTNYTNRESGSKRAARAAYSTLETTYQHGASANIVPPMWRRRNWDETGDTFYGFPDWWNDLAGPGEGYINTWGGDGDRSLVGAAMETIEDSGESVHDQVNGLAATMRPETYKYVESGQRLRLELSHQHRTSTLDGVSYDEPYELLGYLQIELSDLNDDVHRLRRQVSEDGVRYEYSSPEWTLDHTDYIAVRIPLQVSDLQSEELLLPPTPAAGWVELSIYPCIETQSDVDITSYSWLMERPQLLAVTDEGEDAAATVITATTGGDDETLEVDQAHGTGPSSLHDGATWQPPIEATPPTVPDGAAVTTSDWKVGPYGDTEAPSEVDAQLLRAQEALRQYVSRRAELRWPALEYELSPSLTKAIKLADGTRYLPVSMERDDRMSKRDVEAVRVDRDTSLSMTTDVQPEDDAAGDDGGSGGGGTSGGGGGGSAGSWSSISGKPDDIFSRSGLAGTVTLADSDITGALGYTPASEVGGTGIVGEANHKLGIAEDGVTAREIAPLTGDLTFDDGSGSGALVRAQTDGIEVRTQSDPTTFGKITVSEVEIITGGTESTYKSEVVEIADSLVEYNTDATVDAWGGSYVYRGQKSDGSGTGLYSKGLVWNPADDRYGVADVDAANGNGVVTSTFQPLARTNVDETITGAWDFDAPITADDLVEHPDFVSKRARWSIDSQGRADFRRVYTDELVAKAFTTDLTQALAGSDYLVKSVATLDSSFTVPSAASTDGTVDGGTSTLTVQDNPGAKGQAPFESGDWLRVRVVDNSNGGLVIVNAWLQITDHDGDGSAITDNGDGTHTFEVQRGDTDSAATGRTVQRESPVLDYGQSGQGLIRRTVEGPNAPYSAIETWSGDPVQTGNYDTKVMDGNLSGAPQLPSGTDPSGYGLYGDNVFLSGHIEATTGTIQDHLEVGGVVRIGDDVGGWANDGAGRMIIGTYGSGNSPHVKVTGDPPEQNSVQLYYGGNNNWGLRGEVSGNDIFQLGSTNQIAGWTFTTSKLTRQVSGNEILFGDMGGGDYGVYLESDSINGGYRLRDDGTANFWLFYDADNRIYVGNSGPHSGMGFYLQNNGEVVLQADDNGVQTNSILTDSILANSATVTNDLTMGSGGMISNSGSFRWRIDGEGIALRETDVFGPEYAIVWEDGSDNVGAEIWTNVSETRTLQFTVDNGRYEFFSPGYSDGTGPDASFVIWGNAHASGTFTATTKNFLIDHPTREGYHLRHSTLEGPERGIYQRGMHTGDGVILLPDYFSALAREGTVTVDLTPRGSHQDLYVKAATPQRVVIGIKGGKAEDIDCYYVVRADRSDRDPLVVEEPKSN